MGKPLLLISGSCVQCMYDRIKMVVQYTCMYMYVVCSLSFALIQVLGSKRITLISIIMQGNL